MNKIKKEEALKIFQNHGYNVVDEYINSTTRVTIEKDGYYALISLHEIKMGNKANFFGYRNPYYIQNINLFCKKKNKNVVVTKTENIKSKGKYRLIVYANCECGNSFKREWTHFKDGTMLCDECIKKSQIKKQTPTNIKKIQSCGYKIIDDKKYINALDRVLVEDKNGYRGYISACNPKRKMIIFSMFSNKENYLYNVRQAIKNNGLNVEVLSILEDNKANPLLECRCSCGTIFTTNAHHLINGKTRCEKCSNRQSNRELMVEDFLRSKHINYIKEYKLSDCSDILPLPFDFYLKDYNVLIEVDGEQHYIPIRFGGISYEKAENNFQKQQQRDEIKNKYCKRKRIPLLRISYIEIDNGSYKEILNNFIHSVQK